MVLQLFWNLWSGKQDRFPQLTESEKRRLMEISDVVLVTVLAARKRGLELFEYSADAPLLRKLSDAQLAEAVALRRLYDRSLAAWRARNYSEAARLFERLCERAPFFSAARMSLVVQYAYLGLIDRARHHLAEALRRDPASPHVQQGAQWVRDCFGV